MNTAYNLPEIFIVLGNSNSLILYGALLAVDVFFYMSGFFLAISVISKYKNTTIMNTGRVYI